VVASFAQNYKPQARRTALPALGCSQTFKVCVEFVDVSTTLFFARVTSQITTLATSEDTSVRTAQEGAASCVCTVTTVKLRGTVLSSTSLEGFDLWAMKKVLDRLDINDP
jgi:hypothetical protein